jgi:hypothetical protein
VGCQDQGVLGEKIKDVSPAFAFAGYERASASVGALWLSPWLPYGAAEVVAVAFQIVAFTLDADNNVIERRVVPRPYQTRQEAVTAIECIVSTFAEAGYEPAQKFWWAIAHDGDRTRFIIEGI